MATEEAETSRDEQVPPGGSVYDGFISYSHAADDLLAPRLQSGLQRFAKPWWKRRALRLFRDESSLSANPHLWSSITDALDGSGWFVLLLSPEAAESPWVNNEVEYWLEHKDPDRVIPVLTDGEFGWTGGDLTGDAVPPGLQGAFADEPRWVDLRFARTEEQLDLQNPEFSAAIADIASAMRGVPKDELASEEVRQHRRTVRTAWGAGIGLLVLALAASGAALFAFSEQSRANDLAQQEAAARRDAVAAAATAEENARDAETAAEDARLQARAARSRALAASAINVFERDPELSVLLALEAASLEQSRQALSVLHSGLQKHRTTFAVEWAPERMPFGFMMGSLSPDGQRLAITGMADEIEVWDVSIPNEPLWTRTLDMEDVAVRSPVFTIDGSMVIVGAPWFGWTLGRPPPEPGQPYGIYGFDATSGEQLLFVPVDFCVAAFGVLPNSGSFIDVDKRLLTDHGSPTESGGCDQHLGVADIDLGTGEVSRLDGMDFEITFAFGTHSLSPDGRLFAFGWRETTVVRDLETSEVVLEVPGPHAVFSPDGTHILVGGDPLQLWDIANERVVQEYPGQFWTVQFSADGSLVYGARFDGPTDVFDRSTGERLFSLVGDAAVFSQMSEDRGSVATFVERARLYDVSSVVQGETALIPLGDGSTHHLAAALHTGGGLAVTWGLDLENNTKRTFVIDLDAESVLRSFEGGRASLSPDGSLIAFQPTRAADTLPDDQTEGLAAEVRQVIGVITVVDARSGSPVSELEGLCEWFAGSTPEFSGKDYWSGPQTLGPACDNDHLAEWVGDLEFSPDASQIAMSSQLTGMVGVWDVATGRLLWRKDVLGAKGDGRTTTVAFSPDGELLVASEGAEILVFDVATSDEVARLPHAGNQPFYEMEFTPDGDLLLGSDFGNLLMLVDTETWTELEPLEATDGEGVRDVDVSSDGVLAVTAGDRLLRVWSLADRATWVEIDMDEQIRGVEFIDDSHLLVLPKTQNSVVVITLEAEELIEVAQGRVTRSFTKQECATYELDPCQTLEEIRSR